MVFSSTFTIFAKRANMKQAIINKLREFFTLQPVEKAWVFGSYSRGEESRESDIDILVRFDKNANVTLFKYIGIVNALQSLLHKKIDLVEEGQLKDFAKESAEQDKILIYEREPKDINRLSHIIEAIDNLFEVTKGISFDGYKGNKTLRLPLSKIYR